MEVDELSLLTAEYGEELKDSSVDYINPPVALAETATAVSSSYKKYSVFHTLLLEQLRQSQLLSPVHVEVVNESYSYAMRKKLKPRRAMALITKAHASNGSWESYIWKLKRREEDYEIVPQKHFLSTHKSRWVAYKHCESGTIERDGNPAEVKATAASIDPANILNTHFKVLVVSACFDRLSSRERVQLVYEELVKLLGTNLNLPGEAGWTLSTSMPGRLKMASVLGDNVRNLNMFRFLLFDNVTLIIEAKTPFQWRPQVFPAPDTERFGASHFDMLSINIPGYSKAANTKGRVKHLAVNLNDDPNLRMARMMGAPSSSSVSMGSSIKSYSQAPGTFNPDHIGVDPSVSGYSFSKKKTGGIYGHFFHDLSPLVKELVMGRYIANKKLIQSDGVPKKLPNNNNGAAKKIDTFQPKTTMSMLRKKMEKAAVEAEYDRGTSSEAEMVDEVLIFAKMIDRFAVPLQRIWRIRTLKLAVRAVWRRNYATLTLQRVVRGMYARRYVRLLRKLLPIACTRIQRCFRSLMSRRRTAQWQTMTYRLTRVVLPKIKLFLKRCFESWISKRIQKILRGRWGRASLAPLLEAMLKKKVDIPAATCIQRIIRAKLARTVALRKQTERDAAITIQLLVTRFLHRCWRIRLTRERLLYFSATQIQRRFRGRLDREVAGRLAQKHWYLTKFIPSVLRVQSWCRMIVALRDYLSLKRRTKAASKIQRGYRYSVARAEAMARWQASMLAIKDNTAAVIQKIVRAHQARKYFRRLALTTVGRRIVAAKTILRAWVDFRNSKRFVTLLEEYHIKSLSTIFLRLRKASVENHIDREEIRKDIKSTQLAVRKTKERIRVLDVFRIQAGVRLGIVADCLKKITAEDFERGWAEAYDQEYSSLNNMNIMANQEMRCLRVKLNKQNSELLSLQLELEDCEVEDDEIAQTEMATFDNLRRTQVGRIERILNDHRNRLIRRERSKWKTDSNRLNVIQKLRETSHGVLDKVKATRDIKYATTVVYENRAKQWDKEALTVQEFRKNDTKKLASSLVSKYEDYAVPIQETYSNVVSNTFSLLRGWSMDEKARIVRDSTKAKAKAVRAKGQFAPLKEL